MDKTLYEEIENTMVTVGLDPTKMSREQRHIYEGVFSAGIMWAAKQYMQTAEKELEETVSRKKDYSPESTMHFTLVMMGITAKIFLHEANYFQKMAKIYAYPHVSNSEAS